MLSRVANSIYWMSRYIERAENIARIIDVNLLFILENQVIQNEQWEPLVKITGDWDYFIEKYGEATRENVIEFLTFDPEYPNSIFSCVTSAKENARSIREVIASEMWEHINKFYLFLSNPSSKQQVLTSPNEFYNKIKLNSHLFFGITEAVMSHNESWHFHKLGQMLERADKISRIIHVKYFHLLPHIKDIGTTYDDIQWSALLKSASGFEMYRKIYQRILPEKVIEFLILDANFPRSIAFSLTSANQSLHAISGSTVGSYQNRSEQLLGALRAEFAYTDVTQIISFGLNEYIDTFQLKLNSLGDSIYQTFFDIN
ncbi:MAG: alpha-E domain-containing protein, partial [Candidatus Gastranaerophilaceae bacterium]